MWIFNHPPDQLDEGDLRGLVRDRVQEGVTLDFKQEIYGRSDAEIRKMLRDVTSLANANGGILVIGMVEDDNATASELLTVPNAEVESNRLIASCAANVSERIPGLRALRIPIQEGDVVVIWIPPSYRKPHMITFQGSTEFWIRHDRQNVRMSIAEIRSAISATEDLAVKAEEFVRGRRQVWERSGREFFSILATPLSLQDGRIDTGDPRLIRGLGSVPESRRAGGMWLSDHAYSVVTPTLRGLAARDRNPADVTRCLELFRNGHIEFLLFALNDLAYQEAPDQGIKIRGWAVAEVIDHFTRLVRGLRSVTGITDPYVITLSLRGCEGWALYERANVQFDRGPKSVWDEGSELLVDGIIAPLDEESGRTAQHVADRFWNAFRFSRCPFFTDDGRFALPAPRS